MQKKNPHLGSRFDDFLMHSTRARFLYEIKRAAVLAALICSANLYAADIDQRELDLTKPVGSMQNPVRACGPSEQKEYLMRLRCPSGEAPKFLRGGSMGRGLYGSVVDGYNVEYAGAQTLVIIDMYSCKQRELRPVIGYTILAELPAKIATNCPSMWPWKATTAGHDRCMVRFDVTTGSSTKSKGSYQKLKVSPFA